MSQALQFWTKRVGRRRVRIAVRIGEVKVAIVIPRSRRRGCALFGGRSIPFRQIAQTLAMAAGSAESVAESRPDFPVEDPRPESAPAEAGVDDVAAEESEPIDFDDESADEHDDDPDSESATLTVTSTPVAE